ncbi:C40 family peptidase [Aureimonas sp. AU40]|uniref:C40 family peptidase n=1 Tax=Aureimonas sp. AU40 TaxID=1637747 RepID=UPI000784ECE2|nr:C40 family peptidase [Aureimonas sp. AU40]
MTAALDPRLHAHRPDLADRRLEGRVEAARFVEGQPAHVAMPVADLRRRPSADAPLETQALYGERVRVFEDTMEGWSWGQLERDGYVGWIPTVTLVAGEPPEPTHRVSVRRTLVFPGPDIKRPPMHDLPLGARLRVRGEASDHNATYGLIDPFGAVVMQHMKPAGAFETDFAGVAEGFLGVAYLWGGKSALGIDCSGLVQVSLDACGLSAPRDTDLQIALGEGVETDAPLRRGDLVFWRGHVGIMLDGARLLHANAHHMMTAIEPLAEAVSRMEARGVSVLAIRRLPEFASA